MKKANNMEDKRKVNESKLDSISIGMSAKVTM